MTETKDQTLKTIVYEINEFVKKARRLIQSKKSCDIDILINETLCNNQDNIGEVKKCDGFLLKFHNSTDAPTQYDCKCALIKKAFQNLNSTNFVIEKIESNWPLKKGMVNSKIIAWQECSSAAETIQLSIAFMIKCISIITYKKYNSSFPNLSLYNKDNIYLEYFKDIISNKISSLYFWNDIKKNYINNRDSFSNEKTNRSIFYKDILPKNKLIILCFEDTNFRLRSGTNFELFAFEQFINDLTLANNSLIVFSKQKLIPNKSKKLNYLDNYTISFKKSLDEQKYSIQEAMEPDYKLSRDERYTEANKIGAFDRLIELLAKGQNYINTLEKDYSEWKKNTEN